MEFSILEQLCAYLKGRNNTQIDSTSTRNLGGTFAAGNDRYCTTSLQSFGLGSDKQVRVVELERAARTTSS